MSLKYTSVTQGTLYLIFVMFERTIQCLNYSRQESKQQFAVYDSDKPVDSSPHSPGHETWYELVDPSYLL